MQLIFLIKTDRVFNSDFNAVITFIGLYFPWNITDTVY